MKEQLAEVDEAFEKLYLAEVQLVQAEWGMPHTNEVGMNRVKIEALKRATPRIAMHILKESINGQAKSVVRKKPSRKKTKRKSSSRAK